MRISELYNYFSQVTQEDNLAIITFTKTGDGISAPLITASVEEIEPDTYVTYTDQLILEHLNQIKNNLKEQIVYIEDNVSNVSSTQEHNTLLMLDVLNIADMSLYKNNFRFKSNFIICSNDIISIMQLCDNFKAMEETPADSVSYLAGYYNNKPVIVTPALDKGQMIFGYNEKQTPACITFTKEDDLISFKVVSLNNLVLCKLAD